MKVTAQLIEQAYRNLSFSSDKRGETYFKEWQSTVSYLESIGVNQTGIDKLESLLVNYYWSLGRTASTMITGGSNFNVARNQKRQAWSDNHWKRYIDFKEKLINAATKTESNIIKTGDSEALIKLQEKLKGLENSLEIMKLSNKIIRDKKIIDKQSELVRQGLTEDQAIEILKPDCYNIIGFASFSLSNTRQNIKQVKERIAKIEYLESKENKEITINNVIVKYCYSDNRIRLIYPDKPSSEIRTILKKNGFKWSPNNNAWQNFINYRSLEFVKNEANFNN